MVSLVGGWSCRRNRGETPPRPSWPTATLSLIKPRFAQFILLSLRINRETGRNDWYAEPATLLRYDDTAAGTVARPEFFYADRIGNSKGSFNANVVPEINFHGYLNDLNSNYGQTFGSSALVGRAKTQVYA